MTIDCSTNDIEDWNLDENGKIMGLPVKIQTGCGDGSSSTDIKVSAEIVLISGGIVAKQIIGDSQYQYRSNLTTLKQ